MDESKQCVILAKKEYTSILIYYLYPSIYQGIRSIWEDAKKTSLPREVYQNFQNRLIRVRKWNQDVIDHEYKRIVNKTKCEWLNDLIKKVFVLNTQLLAATNINSHQHKIKVQKKWQKRENWKLQNKQIIEKKICSYIGCSLSGPSLFF